VTVEFSPQQSSAMAKSVGAKAEPSSGARNECTWLSSATLVWPVLWKVAAARIRIEALISSANISAMVESMVASVIASRFSGRVPEGASLHDAGMQIEVMRHHRRAENAEREIEHVRVLHDLYGRREATDHLAPIWIGHGDLNAEANRDDAEHGHDERLDPAEAEALHTEDQEHVERGQDHADLERDAEQEIEPNRRADHLCEVGGADGEFGERPQRIGDGAGEGVAAGLREVAVRGYAEPRTQRLEDDRHDVGEKRDREQRVAELRPAGE